jgi:hypothetical protein
MIRFEPSRGFGLGLSATGYFQAEAGSESASGDIPDLVGDEVNDIKLLDSASNAVIARHVGREYPGVLMQGDTLRVILEELEELSEEISRGDVGAASEIASTLAERFTELLRRYERVLEREGIALPYVDRVTGKA